MTVSPALARAAALRSERIAPAAGAVPIAGAALVAGFALTDQRGLRVLLAAALALVFAGLGFIAPRRLVYGVVVWLAVLGFVRRLVSQWSPAAGPADLLLLVGPAAILVLFLVATRHGAFRHRTTFANAVLVISLLVLLGAVNPLQGSLTAGLAGLLFMLVPTLAFWIGRVLCDDATLRRVFTVVAFFSIVEAMYGLAQTFSRFPGWDSRWIATHQEQYAALYVGDFIRPFASFSSAAEYSYFLAVGLIVWLVAGKRRLPLAAGSIVLLAVAIFYASARVTVVAIVAAVGMLLAARTRLPLAAAVVASAALLLLVPIVAASFGHNGSDTGAAQSLASHQVGGLANPLDPQQSTLRNHLTLLKLGLVSAIHNPVGDGIAGVTIAGTKFGGIEQTTEADPSNVAVALGLPGLLAYLVIVAAGLRQAYALTRRRRDALAYAALAVITVTFLQWLNGGQYAIAFLVWLTFGWIDRQTTEAHTSETREAR
jgi:hypothetical protein